MERLERGESAGKRKRAKSSKSRTEPELKV